MWIGRSWGFVLQAVNGLLKIRLATRQVTRRRNNQPPGSPKSTQLLCEVRKPTHSVSQYMHIILCTNVIYDCSRLTVFDIMYSVRRALTVHHSMRVSLEAANPHKATSIASLVRRTVSLLKAGELNVAGQRTLCRAGNLRQLQCRTVILRHHSASPFLSQAVLERPIT